MGQAQNFPGEDDEGRDGAGATLAVALVKRLADGVSSEGLGGQVAQPPYFGIAALGELACSSVGSRFPRARIEPGERDELIGSKGGQAPKKADQRSAVERADSGNGAQ